MSFRLAYVISTDSRFGGAERLLRSLFEGGHDRGYDQLVLNPFVRTWPPELGAVFPSAAYQACRYRGMGDVWATRKHIALTLRRFRPDIVHVMLLRAAVTSVTVQGAVPGAKWLLTHAYGEGIRSAPWGRVLERLDRVSGRRFDRVVAISSAGQRFLVDRYHYPASKVVCIHPGSDGTPVPPARDTLPPTVVSVARLRPEKGHATLVDAFALVREVIPRAQLVLVGDGECRSALESRVEALSLGGSVRFLGDVPDVWPYLAGAHVFALASAYEAFGIAIVEAMAAGLPVVAPAVGGIVDIVSSGTSGELFPAGDSRALAVQLIRLLSTPKIRAAMGASAKKAAESFTIESTLRKYFDVYDDMTGR